MQKYWRSPKIVGMILSCCCIQRCTRRRIQQREICTVIGDIVGGVSELPSPAASPKSKWRKIAIKAVQVLFLHAARHASLNGWDNRTKIERNAVGLGGKNYDVRLFWDQVEFTPLLELRLIEVVRDALLYLAEHHPAKLELIYDMYDPTRPNPKPLTVWADEHAISKVGAKKWREYALDYVFDALVRYAIIPEPQGYEYEPASPNIVSTSRRVRDKQLASRMFDA